MTGSSSSEKRVNFVEETTRGEIPATPAFSALAFESISMLANPKITETKTLATKGERTDLVKNGFAVSGSVAGGLVYGLYDIFWESLFQGAWASNVLKNSNKEKAFAIEESIPLGAGASSLAYLRYRGLECVSGSLTLTADEPANIAFEMLGIGSDDAASAIISGATYAALPADIKVLNSGGDVTSIATTTVGTQDCIRTMDIQFAFDGREEQPRIASDEPCGYSRGAFLPVITAEVYVEDNFLAMYNHMRGDSSFALKIAIGTITTDKYELHFPNCKLSEAPLVTSDTGPAFQNITILPLYDTTEGATAVLTREIV